MSTHGSSRQEGEPYLVCLGQEGGPYLVHLRQEGGPYLAQAFAELWDGAEKSMQGVGI